MYVVRLLTSDVINTKHTIGIKHIITASVGFNGFCHSQLNSYSFFFSSRRRHTRFDCDWSSDVCSSDLAQRNEILDAKDVSALVTRLRAGVIVDIFRQFVPEESVEEQWDIAGLETALKAELHLELPLRGWLEAEPELDDEGLLERITEKAQQAYQAKVPVGAEESFRQYER